ncbi:hypothetical protein HY251_00755, partial [bacterium]|nr:hypothetical protein [bacterium]
ANTKGTLSRARGTASVTTGDKRRLTWNEGPTTLGFDWRLAGDGKLTVTIAKDRTLTVDPATDFEIELRDNGSVPATVVQNTVFVRAGDDVLVRNNGFKIVNKQIDLAKQAGGEGK